MRICYQCGRITSGRPSFCIWCGRSYNVRLCPRLHVNPREAQSCSLCGSHDLSTPQQKLPLWFKPILLLAGLLPGVVLLAVSLVYLAYFVYRLWLDPSSLLLPMLFGLLLSLLWLLWMYVPLFLVRLILKRRNKT